ncbi:MAG TPA: hypothetical protein VFJ85_02650 [Acidimicrobiales bacterium]|nr:hypothetical protein [Acidimicrobiales bacterium]
MRRRSSRVDVDGAQPTQHSDAPPGWTWAGGWESQDAERVARWLEGKGRAVALPGEAGEDDRENGQPDRAEPHAEADEPERATWMDRHPASWPVDGPATEEAALADTPAEAAGEDPEAGADGPGWVLATRRDDETGWAVVAAAEEAVASGAVVVDLTHEAEPEPEDGTAGLLAARALLEQEIQALQKHHVRLLAAIDAAEADAAVAARRQAEAWAALEAADAERRRRESEHFDAWVALDAELSALRAQRRRLVALRRRRRH